MSLGVFIAQQPSAEDFVSALNMAEAVHVRLGTQRLDNAPTQHHLDLRRMLEPAGSGSLFDPHILEELGVTTAVNAGDLCSLANTIRQNYGGNQDRPVRKDPGLAVLSPNRPLWALPVKRSASQVLRASLRLGGVELEWLADVSRRYGLDDFFLDPGPVTKAKLDWDQAEIDAALAHARRAMSKVRFAGVWIGGPNGGVLRHDVDAALAQQQPCPGRKPLAVWMASNLNHCPLDPPYVTDQHVLLVGEKGAFSGIVIDAARGVLTTKAAVAAMADEDFGLPILAA